jgi:acetylornithine deacetylase/succinyl-diaminopimelate desuccinylase-like protein
MSTSSTQESYSVCPDPVELLQRLIRFDTTNPPGNERECVAYISNLLTEAGCDFTIVGSSTDRPNLITRLKGQGTAPPLLLYGHVDVVTTADQTWQHPPFEGRLVDGYVWGRGALDMKSGIVMMLSAFLKAKAEGVHLPGDVILALVSDEEGGGDAGAKYLVDNQAELFEGVRYAIGEFGGFSYEIGRQRFYPIMVAEKQICHLRATFRGPGGHGSMPQRDGAVGRMASFLGRLEQRRLPVHVTPVTRSMVSTISSKLAWPQGMVFRQLLKPRITNTVLGLMGDKGASFEPLLRNSVNPTVIRAGEQINVAPSKVEIDLDGRLLPGYSPEDLISELAALAGGELELEVIRHDPGPSEPDMTLFETLKDILRSADPDGEPVPILLPGATDARFFSRLGIQTYGYLPMRLPPDLDFSRLVHGPDERIPVDALTFGTETIFQLMHRFGQ